MDYMYRVRNLLHWFDIITRDKLIISVKELDTTFFESTLSKQQAFDPGKTLVWIVVRLFNERELLTLRLVQTALDTISLFQLFQCQDKKLCVMLIRQRT